MRLCFKTKQKPNLPLCLTNNTKADIVAHTYNPNTPETEPNQGLQIQDRPSESLTQW